MRCWVGVRTTFAWLDLIVIQEINRLTKQSNGEKTSYRFFKDITTKLLCFMQTMMTFFLSCVYFSSKPLLNSVTVGDPPTGRDPTVRKRDCRGPYNAFFSPSFHNNRRAVLFVLHGNANFVYKSEIWCFKIVIRSSSGFVGSVLQNCRCIRQIFTTTEA